MENRKTFLTIAKLEAFSFLLLLGVAMPLKYLAGMPLAVRIVGALHGGLFILYLTSATLVSQSEKWPRKQWILSVVAAMIPFGPFWFEKTYLRSAA